MPYIPLFLYSFRWNIEVSYYEQKSFWSLCAYMVRRRRGIEMLVNLVNISYCAMKLLPYMEEIWGESVQPVWGRGRRRRRLCSPPGNVLRPVSVRRRKRFILLPAAVRRTIRRFSRRPDSGKEQERIGKDILCFDVLEIYGKLI